MMMTSTVIVHFLMSKVVERWIPWRRLPWLHRPCHNDPGYWNVLPCRNTISSLPTPTCPTPGKQPASTLPQASTLITSSPFFSMDMAHRAQKQKGILDWRNHIRNIIVPSRFRRSTINKGLLRLHHINPNYGSLPNCAILKWHLQLHLSATMPQSLPCRVVFKAIPIPGENEKIYVFIFIQTLLLHEPSGPRRCHNVSMGSQEVLFLTMVYCQTDWLFLSTLCVLLLPIVVWCIFCMPTEDISEQLWDP